MLDTRVELMEMCVWYTISLFLIGTIDRGLEYHSWMMGFGTIYHVLATKEKEQWPEVYQHDKKVIGMIAGEGR